jgi:hypothetical protein
MKKIFWAAFGQEIRTGLVLLARDPETSRGGVIGRVIIELYRTFLLIILEPGDIFMHGRGLSSYCTYRTSYISRNKG